MRIALVHSFYSSDQPSGENNLVRDQAEVLAEAGHAVFLLSRHTDQEQQQGFYPLRAAFRVATGMGPDPIARLSGFRPDIVHVHNLFPNIGSRWMSRWDGPVVQSIHNYRAFCANGLFFRDGVPCFECPDRGSHRSVIHGCYRGSRAATVPLAISRNGPALATLSELAAVVTTSASSDSLIRQFAPGLETRLIRNFIRVDKATVPVVEPNNSWIALGRLSPEKGFLELIEDWPEGESLDLVGDGPERLAVETLAATRGISFTPSIPREEMRIRLGQYQALIFPSRWPEVAPLIVVEAMRLGLPVIAHELNGVSQIVKETGAGLSYHNAVSLRAALHETRRHRGEFSARARNAYERLWSKYAWLSATQALYSELLSR
jgi:glycosyltransferase involved in cell wall biosynthesis